MSQSYEEIIDGERLLRRKPGDRHEQICQRLHRHVAVSLTTISSTRLLEARAVVQLSASTWVRPDLALVASATGKLWLAAEVISSDDHHPDTVQKKALYEELNVPRLWMVDPRYNNVEVYHGTPYGLALKSILAGQEFVSEPLLPSLRIVIDELFLE